MLHGIHQHNDKDQQLHIVGRASGEGGGKVCYLQLPCCILGMNCVQEERNVFVRAELLLDHMHRRSDDDFARLRVALRNLRQEHILKLEHLAQSVPESESASAGKSAAAATVHPSEMESLRTVVEITPVNEQMEVEQPNDEDLQQQNECSNRTGTSSCMCQHFVDFYFVLNTTKFVLSVLWSFSVAIDSFCHMSDKAVFSASVCFRLMLMCFSLLWHSEVFDWSVSWCRAMHAITCGRFCCSSTACIHCFCTKHFLFCLHSI